jgi:hypothetical protein
MVMLRKSPPSEKVAEFLGYELLKARWVKLSDDATAVDKLHKLGARKRTT